MSPDTAQTDKTGPETRAQAISALGDGPAHESPAESHTEPHGATEILRRVTHGRCGCDLCTSRQHAKTDRSQP